MGFDGLVMTVLRWAWGTLLTAMITAVLTVFLRHGKRWFRPVQKFLRTGRWTVVQAHSGQARGGQTHRSAPTVVAGREPKMTVARVLSTLAQLMGKGQSTTPPQSGNSTHGNDVPLDLKF